MLTALLGAACAGRGRPVLPSGPGDALPDGAAIVDAATRTCRETRNLSAEIALSGRIGGRRVRGRLLAGVERPDRVRIEGVAPFGEPIFVLVSREGDGTLWIPRERSQVTADEVAQLIDALAGVPLTASDVVALLTGCGIESSAPARVRRFEGGWIAADVGDRATMWLRERGTGGPPIVVAGTRPVARAAGTAGSGGLLRIDYGQDVNGLPRDIRLSVERGDGGRATDLSIRLSQVEANTGIEPRAFEVTIPAGTREMTIDELRRLGLFGGGS